MNTWGNALPQERALLLTTLFVVVCALLLQLMLTFERRKSARWAATAIGFSALLLLLTLLFDTGRLSGVPCRLLWAVNVLSAAGTAEEICAVPESITGQYLSGRKSFTVRAGGAAASPKPASARRWTTCRWRGVISPAEET